MSMFDQIDRAMENVLPDVEIHQMLSAYEPVVIPRMLHQIRVQLAELTTAVQELKNAVVASHVNTS